MRGDARAVDLPGGVSMPLVGFGTWQITGRKGYDSVRMALDAGYRHVDTATMYRNEAEVGRALRDSGVDRDDIFITTKLPPERVNRPRETLAASLSDLGVAAVDLWLIHWPPSRPKQSIEAWQALQKARDEGLVRAIGVSNYSIAQLDTLIAETGETPAVNQIPWSPWEFSAKRVADHRERGIVLEGYSPFKRSDLRSPVLMKIAEAHGVTAGQVVLRWHIQHGIVVIPKSVTPERIRTNLDVYGFTLSPDEMATIDALS